MISPGVRTHQSPAAWVFSITFQRYQIQSGVVHFHRPFWQSYNLLVCNGKKQWQHIQAYLFKSTVEIYWSLSNLILSGLYKDNLWWNNVAPPLQKESNLGLRLLTLVVFQSLPYIQSLDTSRYVRRISNLGGGTLWNCFFQNLKQARAFCAPMFYVSHSFSSHSTFTYLCQVTNLCCFLDLTFGLHALFYKEPRSGPSSKSSLFWDLFWPLCT